MGFENPPQNQGAEENLTPFREGTIGKKMAEGSHATIHELEASKEYPEGAVVKIGKTTEYSPPLFKWLNLKFSREKTSKLLEKVLGPEFKINPDEDFVRNGVAEYLLLKQYFGRNIEKNTEGGASPPEGNEDTREELLRDLHNKDGQFYKDLLSSVGDEKLIGEILDAVEKHKDDNFLPREQVVMGHPPGLTKEQIEESRQILSYPPALSPKKLPNTYYIIQERARDKDGKDMTPISELDMEELANRPELIEKLLTFALLAKKMYADTGKLIDTRPEEVGKHPLEWFQKTANILIDKKAQDLRFVDTRWLWSWDSKLGKEGLNLVDNLGVRSVDNAIKEYVELLREAKSVDPYILEKRERHSASVIGGPIETKIYSTEEGAPIEIACREFEPVGMRQEKEGEIRKAIIFLPGVGVDAGTRTAQGVAEAFARSSESKTYVMTSKIREEVGNSLYQQAEAIAQLIKEKGMSEITLVGHSQGGDKAVDLVSILQKDKNLKINGLVLLDTVGLYEQKPGELARGFFKDSMVKTPADLIAGKQRNKLSNIKKGLASGKDVSAGIVKDLWNIWRTKTNFKSRVASEVRELAKVNPRLGEVEIPVILMSGTEDPISDPEKLVPAAEEQKLKERNKAGATYVDPREEYLRQTLFPRSPYIRMVAPEKLGHHGLPFFRNVADSSLYLLKRFKRSQGKKELTAGM